MRTVDQWLAEYGESHQNPANKSLHWICVPIIVVSVIGLLWSLPVPQSLSGVSPFLNWGTLVLLLGSIYYFAMSRSLGLGMLVFVVTVDAVYRGTERLAVAAVDRVSDALRDRLDRPVHWALLRGQTAVVLQGPAVPDDRPALAAQLHLSQARHSVLAHTGTRLHRRQPASTCRWRTRWQAFEFSRYSVVARNAEPAHIDVTT